ncbi:hypothetical protein N9903_00745 [bacterium]|nr:hypothetical protein [bacterium]
MDRIISAVWRLRRVLRIEVELFVSTREYHIETTSFDLLDTKTEIVRRNEGDIFKYISSNSDAFSKLARYETGIERSLYRALQEL